MCVQDPFGLACRAARVIERAEVLAMCPRWRELVGLAIDPVIVSEGAIARAPNEDHVLETACGVENRRDLGPQTLVNDQYTGAAIVENIGIFLFGQESIDPDRDRAELECSEEDRDPLGAVEREQRDGVAHPDPEPAERVPHAIGLGARLSKAHGARVAIEGGFIPARREIAVENLRRVVVKR